MAMTVNGVKAEDWSVRRRWIELWGQEDQLDRFDAGTLPLAELRVVFAANYWPWRTMRRTEGGHLVEPENEEQQAALDRLRILFPAEDRIQLLRHSDGKFSALITIERGGLEFSRQYALAELSNAA